VVLERTVRELQGVSCIDMEVVPADKQQIISSRSFGKKIETLEPLLQAVSAYATRASEKLRGQNSYAGRLSVWIESSHFGGLYTGDSQSVTLIGGTSDPRRLSSEAVEIVRRLFVHGVKYAKAGVALMDVRPVSCWQGSLFEPMECMSGKNVSPVMDEINQRFGRQSVKLARHTLSKGWEMKRERLSPNYLGDLSQAVRVSC